MEVKTALRFAIVLLSIFTWVRCEIKRNSIERPLKIGSFNIQNLGLSKMSNKTVMNTVKKILIRYDLVLIQEIVTTDATLMEDLVKDLNKLLPPDTKFAMKISERLGRGTAKEQYAFLYRTEKLVVLKDKVYPDEYDDFMRPPYIVHFSTPTLRDMKSMITIGIHTQPKYAANETSALAEVYDYASKIFKEKNAIIMGDMNAGCANVRISDWEHVDLWTRPEFTWLINHDVDTTLSTNCCPYDRFVIAGEDMNDAIIWDSINVFNFRDAYALLQEQALAVSDHWPIEVKLRGTTLPEAEENLEPSLCLTIHDNRKKTLPQQILNQKSTFSFTIEVEDALVTLHGTSSTFQDLQKNLQRLSTKYPEFLSQEVVDAMAYKLDHGALGDPSSHADLESPWYSATIEFDRELETVVAYCCVATTLNK